ncbi:MAG: hypothetical protein ACHQHN_04150 [Sphingobacteriales bacterium]
MTLTTGGKTYVDSFTYYTSGTDKNSLVEVRSEIAGKLIKFTYAMDLYFRVTLNKIYEYDITTNNLLDSYQYTGYQELEPGIPPLEKNAFVSDADNTVIKMYTFYRQDIDSTVAYMTFGTDTTHLRYDGNKNLVLYDTGAPSTKITYTYDTRHNPFSLMQIENEHLSYAIYAYPQTLVNNPLTISVGGVTKTYTYKYNPYGYPISATVSDGSAIKYGYVARQ